MSNRVGQNLTEKREARRSARGKTNMSKIDLEDENIWRKAKKKKKYFESRKRKMQRLRKGRKKEKDLSERQKD